MFKFLRTHRLSSMIVVITFIMFTLCTAVFANTSSYEFDGIEEYGKQDGENTTAVMKVKDENGNTFKTYCINKSVYTKDYAKYTMSNLEEAGYYSTENAAIIRNIVSNAYPFISIEKLRELSGIKDLTKEEAIAGTQAAIWKFSNGNTQTLLNGNAKIVYDWYTSLPQKTLSKTNIATIDISQNTKIVNDKLQVEILYKVNGNNNDGSNIDLTYDFSKDIQGVYSANIENLGKDINGFNVIKISNLPKDSEFDITVNGTQNLSQNVYFYTPDEGIDKVQSLVGLRDDSIQISNTKKIDPKVQGHSLTLNKIDSLTLTGIGGAEFEVSSTSDFSSNVYTVITKSDGTAKIDGLNSGMWYVKEIKAPQGYIKSTDIMNVYINETDVKLNIKNSKLGNLEVIKIDENNNPVQGAKFSLYNGTSVNDSNVISKDLISDDKGIIYVSNIMPGTYTLVETEAPDGYQLNSQFITFEVKPYETTKVTHVNETIGFCKMGIVKKDVVTKEQLDGAKIGIYADENYTNLLKEITTSKDNAIDVSDLRPGTYYIKELESPKGYLLDSTPKKVTLQKNDVAEVTFYNSKNYSTAGNYAFVFMGGAGLFAVGIIIIISRLIINKRRVNE